MNWWHFFFFFYLFKVSIIIYVYRKRLCAEVSIFSRNVPLQKLRVTLPGRHFLTCFSVSPGGRGVNGSPIIVLPEFPAFGELDEEELQNVLGYLTSVPRWASRTHTRTHTRARRPFCSFLCGPSIVEAVIPRGAKRCQQSTKGLLQRRRKEVLGEMKRLQKKGVLRMGKKYRIKNYFKNWNKKNLYSQRLSSLKSDDLNPEKHGILPQ